MTKPVPDKAEVALEYPDKLYIGTFEGSSRFEAHLDKAGISLKLERLGNADVRKSVHMHFHYALFSAILHDLAATISNLPATDTDHRDALRGGAVALCRALGTHIRQEPACGGHQGADHEVSNLTPHEEVLLLHVME
jgi:hypothetical protein